MIDEKATTLAKDFREATTSKKRKELFAKWDRFEEYKDELSHRDYKIFELYYQEELTAAEVGKQFGLGDERVRQIVKKSQRRIIYFIQHGDVWLKRRAESAERTSMRNVLRVLNEASTQKEAAEKLELTIKNLDSLMRTYNIKRIVRYEIQED